MATIDSIADVQRSVNSQLLARMTEFELQLKSSPSGNVTMFRLSEEFSNFKQNVYNILMLLQQQLAEVVKNIDIAEMRYRRKFLLLSGVPEQQAEDLPSVALSIFHEKLLLPALKVTSFKSCQRFGKSADNKCRPILIKFCDLDTKSLIWRKKTSLKGTNLVLAEFLTKHKQSWFIGAPKHFGIRNVWTQNGAIVIKLPPGSINKIYSQDQFDSVMRQVPSGVDPAKSTQAVNDAQVKVDSGRVKSGCEEKIVREIEHPHDMPVPSGSPWNVQGIPWSMQSPPNLVQFTAAQTPDTKMSPFMHCKRKSLDVETPIPTKQFITEEKMAAHLSGLHISSKCTQHSLASEDVMEVVIDTTAANISEKLNGHTILLSDDVKNLQDEPILPAALIERLQKDNDWLFRIKIQNLWKVYN